MPIPNTGSPMAVVVQDAFGNTGLNTPLGSQSVSIDAATVFNDTFEGATLDTVVRWTTGGTVVPTASGTGNCVVNPGTVASASSTLVSQSTFYPFGVQFVISFLAFEATTIAVGNHRFFGIGTQPGSWTAATPLQDAVGFELDTTGTLRASVYAGGTRVLTQALSVPKDGFAHLYYVLVRPSAYYFSIDGNPVATLLGASPQSETLPVRYHSINGTSATTGTPTMVADAMALQDYSRPSQGISDGQYPWRRATVNSKSLNVAPASNYTVISTAGTTAVATGGGVYYGVNVISIGTTWAVTPYDVVVSGTTTNTLAATATATAAGLLGAPGASGVGVRFLGQLALVTTGTPGQFNALWD